MKGFLHLFDLFWRGACILIVAGVAAFAVAQVINALPSDWLWYIGAGIVIGGLSVIVGGMAK